MYLTKLGMGIPIKQVRKKEFRKSINNGNFFVHVHQIKADFVRVI
jgi:TATA-binding protein-associated factor Taf7